MANSNNESIARKRNAIIKRQEKEFYMNILEQLDKAQEAHKVGDEETSQNIYNSLISNLREEADSIKAKISNTEKLVEIKRIANPGEIFASDESIVLKMICEKEKEDYINVSYECSYMQSSFKEEEFKNDLWKGFIAEYAHVCSIYSKNQGNFIGYCSIKDMREKDWEIAIELLPKYHRQEYGTAALSLLLKGMYEKTHHRFFRARIDIDNFASQGLFRKVGAYPDGISEFLLHGEALERFQQENKDAIDDHIRKTAEEFVVDPEDLLGHVLEYRIDMKSN